MIEYVNLQFFAEEKTEEATEKKKRDTKKKGQVPQSKDIGQSLAFLLVMITIQITSKNFSNQFFEIYNICSEKMADPDSFYNIINLRNMSFDLTKRFFIIIMPFLLMALIIGAMSSFLQVGPLFSLETIKFKAEKINPISGFKRLFSLKSLVEMVKAILKGVVLIYIIYSYLKSKTDLIITTINLELPQVISVLWDMILSISVRCAIFLLIVAILDFSYKKWQHKKDIRMSKKELKDEYKMTEGDPLIKSKIREKQRTMAMSRMMQDVEDADVVITNPTHYAVALKYDSSLGPSPKVLAKGKDLVAKRIKQIAKENDIYITENKELARALYKKVDIGDFIPEELYLAVAEVLAYVYSLRNDR